MILKEEGYIDYDDPIGKYVPELARCGDGVTIRRLLHHVSSFPNYYDDGRLLGTSCSTGVRNQATRMPSPSSPKPAGCGSKRSLVHRQLVSQKTLAGAYRPAILNNRQKFNYGFGWDVGTWKGRRYAAHDGAWLGFISYYFRVLDERFGVIVLLNRNYGLPDYNVAKRIAKIYLDSGWLGSV